jgi:[CysO sulfur-carrier protein]-S-L-cysteine hydrolase
LSKPDDTPLSITTEALQAASRHALFDPTVEACGFILGRRGVGSRVVGVRNVAEHPAATFEMHHQGILDTYAEADGNGEDVIAVYHSHPTSEAIPSELDRQVPDVDPAQLIISLKDGQPRCRAWRIDVPFVGERRATEVMLHVSEDGQPFVMAPPVLPWALTPGNSVLVEYVRVGHPGNRVVAVKVLGGTGDGSEDAPMVVKFETTRKIDPKFLDLSRVRAVTVLRESKAAASLRHKSAMLARRAAHLMANQQYDDVPEILAVLAAAFPPGIAVTEKGKQA